MLRPNDVLTPTEIAMLEYAASGLRSPEIARLRGHVGVRNNEHHGASYVRKVWKGASDKLGADTITQAVAMAVRRGIIK